jgi:hypothetical protein
MRVVLTLVAIVTLLGCDKAKQPSAKDGPPQQHRITVNISLKNSSTNALDWVELQWKGPDVPGGVLPPGISATAIGVPWPNVPNAQLTFIDKILRTPYTIDLSLTNANERIRTESIDHVTFRILSFEKADVVCE